MPAWMSWIPDQSPVAVTIISIGLMLAIGFLMTRITKKLRLPNVTAYIVGGILAGPFCLNLLPGAIVEGTSFLPDIALAFIAFSTGEFFRISTLKKNGGKVLVITVLESCCAAVLVFLVCWLVLGLNFAFSVVLGALATATGELVEREAMAEVGGVLWLEGAGKARVEAGRYVAREHARVCEATAQRKRTLAIASECEHLGDDVLKEAAGHARRTYRADLLLVYQDGEGGVRGDLLELELGAKARIRARTVVVTVAQYHGAVEAEVARGAGGNDFELRGKKVLLVHLVPFGQDLEQ